MLYVDGERCTGCGACLEACPVAAIQLVDGTAAINQELCTKCRACVAVCSQAAIRPAAELLPVAAGEIVAPQDRVVPQPPATLVMHPLSRPWLSYLGAALAWAAQEIVPRVSVYLLEAWDRRQTTSLGQPVARAPCSRNAKANRCRQRQQRGH